MARLDWKRGGFDIDYETNQQQSALRGRADEVGELLQWWRFDPQASVMDDLFDEADSVGRVFRGPVRVPTLHVSHIQGSREDTPGGFYTVNNLAATISFSQMAARLGITDFSEDNDVFLRDRVVYDDLVFQVSYVEILGQVKNRDTIVSVHATQMKRDELVNDAQFARWAG